ncbi:helix-turn-helix domain-containing protein [Halovivax limisalsi]|uniref:helix-turn-helix domain-containing protein n=1 Tax=Halovivax limisalsi TaxID=1453760 RepID=UPI001FFC4DEF|nr:helix-turn-helix domain-containing protein [Halovivax limisalsi]
MRYVTVAISTDEPAYHPIEHELSTEPNVRRRAIHAFEVLDDGTLVLLAEIDGDAERHRELLADAEAVHEFAVADDGSGICYSRVEPTPLASRLVRRERASPVIVVPPIEYTHQGDQLLTLVGRERDLQAAAGSVPDELDVELVATGPYRPSVDGPLAALTDRQREVVDTAAAMGYYENPRGTTHDAIAAALGIEAGTVGKHLRIAESTVFSHLLETPDRGRPE